jgi:hypothetical protein
VLKSCSVLVEFIADLFPKAGILPTDPVQRAQARFFIDQVTNKLASPYHAHILKGGPASDLLAGVEAIQALLPADQPFALGAHLTAADIAIAPFLLRAEVVFGIRDTESVWKTLQDAKYARFWKYYQDLKAHPSVASTFDEVRSTLLAVHQRSSCYLAGHYQSRVCEAVRGAEVRGCLRDVEPIGSGCNVQCELWLGWRIFTYSNIVTVFKVPHPGASGQIAGCDQRE